MGPKGRWVEVQVRSERWMRLQRKDMQLITNIKMAPHRRIDVWLNLLKEALENSQTSAVDFVEDFKMNLYSKEIYVLHQKETLNPYQRSNFTGLRL
jgi:GTP pyrophosphokinase